MEAPIRSVEIASRVPKARRSSRSPVLFASIELGKAFRGFILNASEGGLCVQAAREIAADGALELRFQSVQPGAWVEATGRIAWRNETRTVAGIEFVDQTPEVIQEIRKWLSFGASLEELQGSWEADHPTMGRALADWDLSHPSGREEPETMPRFRPVEKAKQTVARARGLFEPETADKEATDSPVRRPFLMIGVVTLTLLFLGLWAVRHVDFVRHVQSSRSQEKAAASTSVQPAKIEAAATKETAAASEAPTTKAADPAHQTTPAHTTTVAAIETQTQQANLPAVTSQKKSGGEKRSVSVVPTAAAIAIPQVVLQAAAMSDENNANELAASLREKNFPAFVSKRNSFFRVFVGPFLTDEAVHRAKNDLKKSSVETIQKPWSP